MVDPSSQEGGAKRIARAGIDLCHETVRLWWDRFGPMFAADIRRQLVSRMKGFRHSHRDEVYVKLNGAMHYLWRAVDHEGEILESCVAKTRDKAVPPDDPKGGEANSLQKFASD